MLTDMLTSTALLATIFFIASFGQTISGFGFALVGMPLATLILGTRTAAPLVALTGLSLYTINVLRYRNSIHLRHVARLGIAAALGVPVGIWGLVSLDESFVKLFLGFILVGYTLFSIARPTLSFVPSHRWGYLAGFLTGCLGGAYNLPGPPLIVYGAFHRWERDEFRAMLQSLFFLTGLMTVASHLLANHLTLNILTIYALTAPAVILGIVIGAIIDRRINHAVFRWIVVALIFILGLSLIIGGR